ncbi:MAG: AAA family ATPase [Methanomassiliicoccaceae archaeon]|nr:AAA family ATPase [Methanomassiliicoccaceae archaeon]
MKGLVGRGRELGYLEALYLQSGLKTCAVYGRRQVGKSTLLREFTKDKRTIFIQSSKQSGYENMVRMRADISQFLGKELPAIESFTEIMAMLERICKDEKTIIVFDEYPYLISDAPYVPSILQRFIDIDVKDTESMIIICGSSVSMMRDETEKMDRPLYGRFTNRLVVDPLDYRTCMEFHRNMSEIDALKVYMTVGGIPKYHQLMNCNTYEGCIKKCYLEQTASLIDEGHAVISNELSPFEIYSGIIACISDGAVKLSDIAQKMRLDRSSCKRYLNKMESLGFIGQPRPMLGAPKRPIYKIDDNLISFHYEIIRRHGPMLSSRSIDQNKKYALITNDISTFIGHRFEELCGQYIDTEYNVKERGRWWGRVGTEDTDIDIVAFVYDDDLRINTILAECKFRRQKTGFSALNSLTACASHIGCIVNEHYILFSASGFEGKLEEFTEDHNVMLVDLDKLLGRSPPDKLDRKSGSFGP